jgi:hypothetical protein
LIEPATYKLMPRTYRVIGGRKINRLIDAWNGSEIPRCIGCRVSRNGLLARGLVEHSVVVVSGLAARVDRAAPEAAIAYGLKMSARARRWSMLDRVRSLRHIAGTEACCDAKSLSY